MTGRERLDAYLNSLRRRLRAGVYAQALAAAAVSVLLITGVAVWWWERQAFAPGIAWAGRIAIAAALAAIAVVLLWTPLRRLRRHGGAEVFEARLPAQSGRIQTYLDAQRAAARDAGSPLIDLLADEAADIAERTPVQSIAPGWRLATSVGMGVLAITAIVLLLGMGPAHWGFGSRHLLLGADVPRDAVPVRRVTVEPGDATVRRNSDFVIRASVEGFDPRNAQVHVRFDDQAQWEIAPMQAASDERARFEFRLYAVRGALSYYVDADGIQSPAHTVAVVDLPKIERVRLTYSYPDWTGLDPVVDEEVRDIRAVAGTSVKVEVFADAPLESPALIVDGATSELEQAQRGGVGEIDVKQPGSYQIGARVANEFVALSDEYLIEIVNDEKPEIEIHRPGRDWRATSIEEVPVRVQAQDDFRLRNVALHYSVNGGDWRALKLGGGAKQSDQETLLRLEELGDQQPGDATRLAPGDLVSYYAVARDHKHTVQSDLYMVQVQPFERRYQQSQGGGGGGAGMSDEQGDISERQREILLATWNLQRNDERNARSRQQLRDSARMLSELQATLAQQARTLAARTRARASLEDERIKTFVDSLEAAAAVMDPAAKRLNDFKLAAAIPVEQQALQQLLRAEAAFREVQVSMQQDAAGGGGAQNSRNFAEMFELEMDLEKNQYETQSQLSMQNSQAEMDEAIRKLKELAERQEKLAQQTNRTAQIEEQRWKQEQLRREAEDLRRRLEELDRRQANSQERNAQQQGSQSGQQANSQPGGQSSGSSQGQASGGESSSQSTGDTSGESRQERRSEVAEALASVNRALEDMNAAREGAQGDEAQATQSAREAGQNLRRALSQIDQQPRTAGMDEALAQLATRAGRISEEQRRIESELYEALSASSMENQLNSRGAMDRARAQALVQSKQQMAAELTALQRDLRNAVHEHRARTPGAARRVSEIIRELESSEVMYRVNRSAAEIYYGRAREAAMREGLIAESLDTLEQSLREASAMAAREGKGDGEGTTPDTLLAEVAAMRQALQADASQSSEGADGDSSPRGGSAGEFDLSRGSPLESATGRGSLGPETTAIGRRVRDAANRMSRGELSRAEYEALRNRANELRRLAGDPMADQRETMLKLIDQIELAALAAAPASQDDAAARATPPSPGSPRYREAVAEYYRRLGAK